MHQWDDVKVRTHVHEGRCPERDAPVSLLFCSIACCPQLKQGVSTQYAPQKEAIWLQHPPALAKGLLHILAV
jgi:hypothetical protein